MGNTNYAEVQATYLSARAAGLDHRGAVEAACALVARHGVVMYSVSVVEGALAYAEGGATLSGRAKRYSDRYRRSAEAVAARCGAREVRGPHGKRILCLVEVA